MSTTEQPDDVKQALAAVVALEHDDLAKLENQLARLAANPGRVRVDRPVHNHLIRFVRALRRSKAPQEDPAA